MLLVALMAGCTEPQPRWEWVEWQGRGLNKTWGTTRWVQSPLTRTVVAEAVKYAGMTIWLEVQCYYDHTSAVRLVSQRPLPPSLMDAGAVSIYVGEGQWLKLTADLMAPAPAGGHAVVFLRDAADILLHLHRETGGVFTLNAAGIGRWDIPLDGEYGRLEASGSMKEIERECGGFIRAGHLADRSLSPDEYSSRR